MTLATRAATKDGGPAYATRPRRDFAVVGNEFAVTRVIVDLVDVCVVDALDAWTGASRLLWLPTGGCPQAFATRAHRRIAWRHAAHTDVLEVRATAAGVYGVLAHAGGVGAAPRSLLAALQAVVDVGGALADAHAAGFVHGHLVSELVAVEERGVGAASATCTLIGTGLTAGLDTLALVDDRRAYVELAAKLIAGADDGNPALRSIAAEAARTLHEDARPLRNLVASLAEILRPALELGVATEELRIKPSAKRRPRLLRLSGDASDGSVVTTSDVASPTSLAADGPTSPGTRPSIVIDESLDVIECAPARRLTPPPPPQTTSGAEAAAVAARRQQLAPHRPSLVAVDAVATAQRRHVDRPRRRRRRRGAAARVLVTLLIAAAVCAFIAMQPRSHVVGSAHAESQRSLP